ncbi:MAG: Gfo/Idh/MocA family oxidoreductase [Pseudomonadales bacterium]
MIRFGTLGAARITPRALIYPVVDEPRASIRCIAARDRQRAQGFALHHNIPVVVDSYDEIIADEKINAVYIPLPITAHKEWTIKALQAGKHVLCEKSFAANEIEAQEMLDAGQATGLVLMDAFHYRYHPIFLRARELFLSGDFGEIHSVDAAFHIPVSIAGDDIRMVYEQGGGVTMDIGCYPLSWVRHITGEEPLHITAEAEVGPPNVDTMLKASMELPSGIKASASGDMRGDTSFVAVLKIEGSKGSMTVNNPLIPQIGNSIELVIGGKKTIEKFDRRPSYGYQLDAFLNAVENDGTLYTSAEDAVKQMRLIDRCYKAAGLPQRGLNL